MFITLVMLGTMIILNLFIGVIMNGMNAAQEENDMNERAHRLRRCGHQGRRRGPDLRSHRAQLRREPRRHRETGHGLHRRVPLALRRMKGG
ncbi:MAG TPA: hypothetical protein VM285_15875 [Polyangia bacterium]|nr:hypothetical protein [Polyangia bacterium]